MRPHYNKPTFFVIELRTVALFAGSKADTFEIGGESSKNPLNGNIIDDYGDGPGVSGARSFGKNSWEEL